MDYDAHEGFKQGRRSDRYRQARREWEERQRNRRTGLWWRMAVTVLILLWGAWMARSFLN